MSAELLTNPPERQRASPVTEVLPAVPRSLGNVLGIDLWLITVDDTVECGNVDVLSSAERARAERFVFERDRRRHVAARVALRQLLSMRTGEPAAQLRFEYGPYGKPRLGSGACAFNVSRSAQRVLVAISDAGDIGADIELARPTLDAARLADEVCTPGERAEIASAGDRHRAFLQCWTRKEACVKAIGCGLSLEPRRFEAGTTPEQRLVQIAIDGRPLDVAVTSLQAGDDLVAAVARVI
jgi:4'-phosphopantetheinyl transferase